MGEIYGPWNKCSVQTFRERERAKRSGGAVDRPAAAGHFFQGWTNADDRGCNAGIARLTSFLQSDSIASNDTSRPMCVPNAVSY